MTNLTSDECISTLTLHKVWLAPDLKASLISTSALDKDQINTLIKEGVMTFRLRNQPPLQPYSQPQGQLQSYQYAHSIVGYATYEGEHYWLNCCGVNKVDAMLDANFQTNLFTGSLNSVFATKAVSTPISIDLAHRRACHAGENPDRKMETCSDGVKLKKGSSVTFPYTPYIKGKGHALPFGKERTIRSKPGEFIHLDVWGPISIASHGGERYFITFTDDATRFTWLYPLKSWSQNQLKTQFGYTVKKVHGDDANESELNLN